MVARLVEKIHLSAKGLIGKARSVFKKIKEPIKGGQGQPKEISLTDCLTSALAIFKLKFSSLLQFEDAKEEEHVKQNLKNKEQIKTYDTEAYCKYLQSYDDLLDWMGGDDEKSTDNFKYLERVKNTISNLGKQFPNTALMRQDLEELDKSYGISDWYHQFMKLIEEAQAPPSEEWLKKYHSLKLSNKEILLQQLIECKKYELARFIFLDYYPKSKSHLSSKAYTSLFLDKVPFSGKSSYEGGNTKWTTQVLINVINGWIEKEESSEEKIPKLLDDIARTFLKDEYIPQLERCGTLSVIGGRLFRSSSKEFAKLLVETLNKLEVGEKMLVPCGCKNHATGLLVHRTSEKEVSLTIYNTGGGVKKHHHPFENGPKFQTYWTMEKVSLNNVKDTKIWKQLVDLQREADNMDPVYTLVKDEMGKGGVQQKASSNPEDYEQVQMSGSCAYQFMMAYLRYQIMQLPVGDIKEQFALYKILKAKIFHIYGTDNLKHVDQVIAKAAQTKVKKLSEVNRLITALKDDKSFNHARDQLQDALSQTRDKELAKSLKDLNPPNFLGRYQLLRTYSLALAKAWLHSSDLIKKLPDDARPSLGFALAQYEHQKAILDGTLQELQILYEEKDTKDFVREVTHKISASPLGGFFLLWVVDKFQNVDKETHKSDREKLKALVCRLAIYPNGSDSIKQLEAAYRDPNKGLNDVADFVANLAL